MSKILTDEQAETAFAFILAVEELNGVWPAIETHMRDLGGIDDPDEAVEQLRQALSQ